MKKVIRLTESDLARIVKRVIKESNRGYLMEEVAKDLCLTLVTRIVDALNTKINEFKTKNPNTPTSTFTVKNAGRWSTKEGETPKYGIFYAGKDLFNEQGFTDSDLTDKSMVIDQNKKDQTIIIYRNMISKTFSADNLNPIFAKAGTKNLDKINSMNELKDLVLKIFNNWVLEITPKVPTTKTPTKQPVKKP
jgi:hypothetical protein